jgi:hypothetical protein
MQQQSPLKFLSPGLIFVALSLCFFTSYSTTKAIVKANILRGESFAPCNSNPKDIEAVVCKALAEKGFEILNTVVPQEDVLFVDLFVYHFPSQFPAVTLIIRTKNGIHYVDQEYVKLYVEKGVANLELASKLAGRVPVEIDKNVRHKIGLSRIISPNKTPGAVSKVNYFSMIKWKDDNSVPFVVPNELNLFLLYASNYDGLKKLLQRGPITLRLRINSSARFELVDTLTSSDLDEKQRTQIQAFVDSFPLWMTDIQVEGIEIKYGMSTN